MNDEDMKSILRNIAQNLEGDLTKLTTAQRLHKLQIIKRLVDEAIARLPPPQAEVQARVVELAQRLFKLQVTNRLVDEAIAKLPPPQAELQAKAVELWYQGLTQAAIGQAIGRSQSVARKLLIKAGIDPGAKPEARRRVIDEHRAARLAEALQARESGATFAALGKQLNVSRERARQIYRKGCRVRARGGGCLDA